MSAPQKKEVTLTGKAARPWFFVTAAIVLAGLVMNIWAAAENDSSDYVDGHFYTAVERAFNQFTYFTLQTNIIVLITAVLLVINPRIDATWFRVLRLNAVVGVVIAAIVYHTLIAGTYELETLGLIASDFLHILVPILAVVGWFLFRSPSATSTRDVWLSLVFPICWLAFTLIRGAIIGWYPYGFVDVDDLGYALVVLHCLGVTALLLLISWLARFGELAARRRARNTI